MVDTRQLHDQPFLNGLVEEELASLAGIIKKQDFPLGETIFKASQEGHALYFIRSGEAKACMAAPDGELFTLRILKEGDVFGAMSFVDATQRSATIIAISDLADQASGISLKLMENIIRGAHIIVREMNARYIEMINYMWGRKRFT